MHTAKKPPGIAVIGLAGRFPGAPDIAAFWQLLADGREGLTHFTPEDWAAAGRDRQDFDDPDFIAAHGVLADYDAFDAAFFGYSSREAALMDPQQRLFLQTACAALEDAGYGAGEGEGGPRIGVFAGASANTYLNDYVIPAIDAEDTATVFQANYANQPDFLATRVSYKLGLTGPSLTVQTACSTSLVAIHMAAQSLLSGESDIALAGGVSVSPPARWGYRRQEGMIFSQDGHCRAFSADASGTLKGDGVGVVVLKRLDDALADADKIDAVILGSAINNDGETKAGYTAPGFDGQCAVLQKALDVAAIAPHSVTMLEAHGTGTPLGDPLEVSALTHVYGAATDQRQFCGIGSVKTNIGHLDAAAGVAGFIKSVLALKKRQIPPSLHFAAPNPAIDFAASPVYVNAQLRDWPVSDAPPRAAVSSFGIGGTNAHIILESAPAPDTADTGLQPHPSSSDVLSFLPVSGKSPEALSEATRALADQLEEEACASKPDGDAARLEDAAYTLQLGKAHYGYRRCIVSKTMGDAAQALRGVATTPGTKAHKAPRLGFLCPGQGAQYPGMGAAVYRDNAVFARALDQCFAIAADHGLPDLKAIMLPECVDEAAALQLQQTAIAQPALCAVGIALGAVWSDEDITPTMLCGHSIGEITAAALAGVFSIEDAMRLVILRGQLMQSMPPGDMLAVPATPDVLDPYVSSHISIAAINAPDRCVIAGASSHIADVRAALEADIGLATTVLQTSHAFHSPMMQPIVERFKAAVANVDMQPPRIPIASSVTGSLLSADDACDPAHWARNIADPVRFADAAKVFEAAGTNILLEVGPGTVLSSLAKRTYDGAVTTLSSLGRPKTDVDDTLTLARAKGDLWAAGLDIDLGAQGRIVSLPTYPFARTRHWMDMPSGPKPAASSQSLQQPAWSAVRRLDLSRALAADEHVTIATLQPLREDRMRARADSLPNAAMIAPFEAPGVDHVIDFHDLSACQESLGTLWRGSADPRLVIFVSPQGSSDDVGDMPSHINTLAAMRNLLCGAAHCAGDRTVTLVVAGHGLVDMAGAGPMDPTAAACAALARVAGQETRNMDVQFVNLAHHASPEDIWHSLADALRQPEHALDICAYQDGLVYQRHFQRLAPTPKPDVRDALNTGAWVITGGAGRIGCALAKSLLDAGASGVVLSGRSAQPGAAAQALIDAFGQDRVLYRAADVTDGQALQSVLYASARFGSLVGVVHCAGVAGLDAICPVEDLTQAMLMQLSAAKVEGARQLARLCGQVGAFQPRHVVLMSSLASLLGGLGNGAYASANAYLDGLAARMGPGWTSINWDAWDFEGAAAGVPSVPVSAATAAFQAAVHMNLPQLAVARREVSLASQPQRDAMEQAQRTRDHVDTSEQDLEGATQTQLTLARLWADALGAERIQLTDNFFELGGDSVMCIQIVSKAKKLGLRFTPEQVFQHQSVAALAAVLDAQEKQSSPPETEPLEESAPGDFTLSGLDDGDLAQLQKLLGSDD